MHVNKFRKQKREALKALTIMSANRNVEKIENNQNKRKTSNRRKASNIRKINEYECLIIL
jgi:hypothetical protein